MAIIAPIDRDLLIDASVDGQFFEYGPGGTAQTAGTLVLMFVPDVNFVGQFTMMGRVGSPMAVKNLQTPVPVPYRRVTVNDVASDRAVVSDTIVPTGPTLIEIAANFSPSILVSCTQGTCWVYCSRLQGSST